MVYLWWRFSLEIHLVYYLFVAFRWIFRRMDSLLQRDPMRLKAITTLLEDPEKVLAAGPTRLRAASRWFSFWPLWVMFSLLVWMVVVLLLAGLIQLGVVISPLIFGLGILVSVIGAFVCSWLVLSGLGLNIYLCGVEISSLGRKVWLPWVVFSDHRGEPVLDRADPTMVVIPCGRENLRLGLAKRGAKVMPVIGEDSFPVYFRAGLGMKIFDGCEIAGLEMGRLLMYLGLILGEKRPIRVNAESVPRWVIDYQEGLGKTSL
jgi:hypothetical protein